MISKFKYHILLHLIIFMWGFTGILGKLISIDAFSIVWYRIFIAFVGLIIYFLAFRKSFKVDSPKHVFQLIAVGALVAFHWLTFYEAIKLSTASLGILCLSTTTIHVAWLEPLIMKRRISFIELFFGLIIILGIYFVSDDFQPHQYKALFYGLLSALLAASFSVFNAKLVKHVPSGTMSLYEMGAGVLILSVVLVLRGGFTSEFFHLSLSDFLWLLFLGLACTSFAFVATINVLKHLGAFTVTLSINLEPIYTILLAIVLLQEHELLQTKFYIGTSVILIVVLLNAYLKYRLRQRTAKKSSHLSA